MATDDEINELIMRSESELEMWSTMDQARLAQQSASAKALPRLMQVSKGALLEVAALLQVN